MKQDMTSLISNVDLDQPFSWKLYHALFLGWGKHYTLAGIFALNIPPQSLGSINYH